MGILLMNIGGFALPGGAYFNPHAVAVHGQNDVSIWFAEFILIDGKFRNIFSLLFGAGILLLLGRAAADGRDEGQAHMRRMAVLGVFGLAHAYLLWWGDILFQYAVIGSIALFAADCRPATLLRLSLACLVGQFALAAGTILSLASLRGDAGTWPAIAADLGTLDQASISAEITRLSAGYGQITLQRLTVDASLPFDILVGNGLETLGLMLFGMAAFRSGFLTGGWPRRRYIFIALGGYIVGIPAMVLLGLHLRAGRFDPIAGLAVTTLWSLPVRPILAVAHVALAIVWIGNGRGAVRARIGAVGRAAFTNYLGASLVMTSVFYGYGLGLFGRLDRLALLGIVLCGWVLMLAWSKPWLDRYHHGPLEYLWRRLAYGPRLMATQ